MSPHNITDFIYIQPNAGIPNAFMNCLQSGLECRIMAVLSQSWFRWDGLFATLLQQTLKATFWTAFQGIFAATRALHKSMLSLFPLADEMALSIKSAFL